MKFISLASIIALTLVMAGCGSSSQDSSDTGQDSSGTGSMSLRITDAPIDDASSVVVQFSEVQVRGAESSQNLNFTFDPPKSIDLLTLQGTSTEVLFTDEEVPAGVYDEIRLIINAEEGTEDTYIVLEVGGAQHDMTVPSGSQSGLKVKGPLTVTANATASFTIDFDVRKSIVKSGNVKSNNGVKYHLKPVLRIVDNSEVGNISGRIDATLLTQAAGCSDDDVMTGNAVYVFEGLGVTADDIDLDEATVEPVVTALVEYDSVSDTYNYELAFLTEGDYTVSFTCNADAENVEENNDLMFKGSQDASVTAGQTTTADFL
jgi:hypothetical protein